MSRKLPSAALLLGLLPFVAIPLLLAIPLFDGEVLLFRDLASFVIPQQAYGASVLSQGRLPLWNPLLHGGVPFFAEPGTGVLYPFNIVYLLLPPHIAATVFVLLHVPVAAGGAMLLARTLGLSRSAATLAAIGYGTSGYLMSMHGGQYYFASAALLPLAVALLVRVADVPSSPRVAAAAAALGLMGLNGEPQTLLLAGGTGALLGLVRSGVGPRNLVAVVASLGLGALIGAVQLLPSWLYAMSFSTRTGGLPLEEASFWSFHPLRWLEFVASAPFGRSHPENTFWGFHLVHHPSTRWPWAETHYLGPAVAGMALLFPFRGASPRLKLLPVLVVFSLVLAAGEFTPVFEYWFGHVPFVRNFRYPEKYAVVTALGLVLLGAAALDQASDHRNRFVRGFALMAALFGAAALVCRAAPDVLTRFIQQGLNEPIARSLDPEECVQALAGSLARTAAICAALCAVHWLGRLRPAVVVTLLLAVAFVDGSSEAMRTLSYGTPAFLEAPPSMEAAKKLFLPGSTRRIARQPECEKPFIYKDIDATMEEQFSLQGWIRAQSNRPLLWGVAETEGYSPMVDSVKRQARHQIKPIVALHRLQGAAALIVCSETETAVVDFPSPLSRVAVVAGETVAGREALLRRLSDVNFDYRRLALVDETLPPHAGRGIAQVVEDQPERVGVEVRGEGGLLVLADSYAEGWRAEVDGQPARVLRANLLWRGILVPAGEHKVVFEYECPGLRVGAWTSALAAVTALVLAAVPLVRARRRRAPATP